MAKKETPKKAVKKAPAKKAPAKKAVKATTKTTTKATKPTTPKSGARLTLASVNSKLDSFMEAMQSTVKGIQDSIEKALTPNTKVEKPAPVTENTAPVHKAHSVRERNY